MDLAIVADSHGAVDRLEAVLEKCRANGWGLLHAGDGVVDPLPDLLRRYSDVPVWWARGNADMDDDVCAEIAAMLQVEFGEVVAFDLDGVRFVAAHRPGDAARKIDTADVWVTGHTHRASAERTERGIELNPGALYEDGMFFHWRTDEGRGERLFFR